MEEEEEYWRRDRLEKDVGYYSILECTFGHYYFSSGSQGLLKAQFLQQRKYINKQKVLYEILFPKIIFWYYYSEPSIKRYLRLT